MWHEASAIQNCLVLIGIDPKQHGIISGMSISNGWLESAEHRLIATGLSHGLLSGAAFSMLHMRFGLVP